MKILQTAAILLAFTACASRGAQENESAAPASGTALYAQYCTGCHGEDGKLGLGGAKDLSASSLSQEEVSHIIKNGSANKKMMAYGNVLSESELRALSEYVMSLRKP
jgi:mono/diheme cytochrome c family protein